MSIWDYREIRKSISTEDPLTLGEAKTPMIRIKNGELRIKREDLNPTGSWKDRGSAYKMTELKKEGVNEAVISSSGNAAISLLTYAKLIPGFKLHVVVSNKINPAKLEKIQTLINGTKHELHVTEATRKKSIELSAKLKIPNLRSSIDDSILKGYWSLGFELAKEVTDSNDAIFVPVSSGTALVGLTQGLFMKLEQEHLMPRIFVCQTQSVHPIVDQLTVYSLQYAATNSELQTANSHADAIIDTIALRSPQILKIIKETNGDALAITNEELEEAKEFITANYELQTVNLSFTSLLSIAGYLRIKDAANIKKAICIASGL